MFTFFLIIINLSLFNQNELHQNKNYKNVYFYKGVIVG